LRNNNRITLGLFTVVFSLLFLTSGLFSSSHSLQAQDADSEGLIHFPLFFFTKTKPASTSYYLPTVDPDYLYGLGCEQGSKHLLSPGGQDAVVVLNFSYPVYDTNFGYGAALYEDNPWENPTAPVPIADIIEGVQHFAMGYYNCSGTDTKSNLVVGVGTNNKATSIGTETRATAHGQAWGSMVSSLIQWALDEKILHQVQFYGASNIESWNNPTWTRAWINGFERNDDVFLLNFGDAAGCPYDENPHWSCSGDWSVEDVWYVSWGAPSALPLPLIFLTNGVHAKQWAHLSQYSVENHGYRINFTGVFTSWQYCQQFSWCNGIDNTPEEAYQQLMHELDKDPATAQTIRWKTDIRWVRENEVAGVNNNQAFPEIKSSSHPIQEEIEIIEVALQATDLSNLLRTSLETKHSIYQTLADKILLSQQTPAPKD
jgi:hypothetical protein